MCACFPYLSLSDFLPSYFGIIIPAILNLIGLCGFNILNGILGGQALASVSTNMSWECVWHLTKSFILPNPYQCRHCHYLRHCASRAFSYVILEILCLHNDHTFRSPSWATEYLTGKRQSLFVTFSILQFPGTNVFRGSQFLSHSWLHSAWAARIWSMLNRVNLLPLLPFSALHLLLLDSLLLIRQWHPISRCTTRPPFPGKRPIAYLPCGVTLSYVFPAPRSFGMHIWGTSCLSYVSLLNRYPLDVF